MKGIRQGCKCAPILWALYFVQIFAALHEFSPWQWLQQCLTAFADDICQHDIFHSQDDFIVLLRRAGYLMDCLENAGLPINIDKTVALCRMTGRKLQQTHKRFFLKNSKGTFLKIPRGDGSTTLIHLVNNHTYLGVKLSYHHPEKLTMNHRLQAGTRTQQLLHKWLHLKRGLNPRQRVKLWQQCVFTSSVHGLIHTGFDVTHALQFHRTCLRQLRRIHREPVHLNLLSNTQFLAKHGILPPLIRLWDLCQATERREWIRFQQLHVDDILCQQPAANYDERRQVLQTALQQLHYADKVDRPSDLASTLQCPHCDLHFDTPGELRRHSTVIHGLRSGQQKQIAPSDFANGLPTCRHCNLHFTSVANFRYHIKFVCTQHHEAEHAAELEHRLLIVEFLQYSNGAHFQALQDRSDLLMYMKSHCILCGRFALTARGMFLHWAADHPDDYQRHGHFLQGTMHGQPPTSPCSLCGSSFTRSHRCIIHSQIAMHAARTTPVPQTDSQTSTAMHTCPQCPKAYVTKHGLRQHIQRYHRSLEANDSAEDDDTDIQQAHAALVEAVEQDDCATLLLNPLILEYLGTWCPICCKAFGQKNTLTRHLRHHHATLWNDTERFAMELSHIHCPAGECFCLPEQRTKHLCTIFIQYSMLLHQTLRYAGVRDPAPGLAGDDLPADFIATPAQQISSLVFHGQVEQIYGKRDLRLAISLHCLFCDFTCRNGEMLATHCQLEHGDLWDRSNEAYEYLLWLYYSVHGCCCNPMTNNEDHHMCISLKQISMIWADLGMPIFLPYAFSAKDTVDLLDTLVEHNDLTVLTMHLLQRRIGRLFGNRALHRLLQGRCIICHEILLLCDIKHHMQTQHNFDLRRFQMHQKQLASIYTELQSEDPACDFCGEYMSAHMTPGATHDPVYAHLCECNLILHLAVFLGHPTWEVEFTTNIVGPSTEVRLAAHRQRERRSWQLQAPPSDPAEAALVFQLQCAKPFLDDEWMRSHMNHTCLCCNRMFFSVNKFLDHLMTAHNYHQYMTEKFHHMLVTLQTSTTCKYCGTTSHANNFGKRCIALFNLSVALCNGQRHGRYGHPRLGSSSRHLAKHAEPRSAEAVRKSCQRQPAHAVQRQDSQTPQIGEGQADACEPKRPTGRDDAVDGQNDTPTGGRVERHADGASVPFTCQRGQRQHSPGHAPTHSDLESGEMPLHGPTATSTGGLHDVPAEGSTGQFEWLPDQGRCREGMLAAQHSESEVGNAVPTMESSETALGAQQRSMLDSGRNSETGGKHNSADEGRDGHSEISQSSQDERDTDQCHPMDLDSIVQNKSGTLAPDQKFDFSRMLAADPMSYQKPWHAEIASGTTAEPPLVKRLIRLCLNGSQTLCYANAALQSLAWVSILSLNMVARAWQLGFDLLEVMTQWTPMPVSLYDLPQFRCLFPGGDWGSDKLDQQCDLVDFTSHILLLMEPAFVNNLWVPQPTLYADFAGTMLQDEKGHRLQPITMNLIDPHSDKCTFTDIVNHWHDSRGFCRSLLEASNVCCVAINRVYPNMQGKCQQQIDFQTGLVQMPFFDVTRTVQWKSFRIIAIAFHIGVRTTSGHWRTALFHNHSWFAYDDGMLPVQYTDLPMDIQRQAILIWLISADRTPLGSASSSSLNMCS